MEFGKLQKSNTETLVFEVRMWAEQGMVSPEVERIMVLRARASIAEGYPAAVVLMALASIRKMYSDAYLSQQLHGGSRSPWWDAVLNNHMGQLLGPPDGIRPEPGSVDHRSELRGRPKLRHTGELTRGYSSDAGLDLRAASMGLVAPGEYKKIPCEVQVEFPEGVFGWIVARSSTFQDFQLFVLPGIIDTGFRGPMFASVYNAGSKEVFIEQGQRIAQLVLLPNVAQSFDLERLHSIDSSTDRGTNGFGSTGR